ncbi:alanine/glycine:cation symporter family protein [Tolumonas osonensis]|uniref:AGCS family alanine or glycine:cation symporter n=1 Tax=Tolumonas osonensis TaxID=675874 RepID=A0A841GL20_9GAMM|nr:sodium:alanine symporter family protein [Tolumonas osonensis]MBB6055182.1 AGCS family alanine or glycine:cation symporter [Tolumonas osonensis]
MLHSFLTAVDDFIWGPPLLALLMGTGLYLTIRLGLLQVIRLPLALKLVFFPPKHDGKEGDVSSFAALCTALSATIGTGNIVGVATAVKLGGPGAIFWMWIAAFLGMATKYAEGLLAVRYRQKDANGQMSGGPMYYLEKGLGSKFLAGAFALFGIGVALFGIGTFPQVNAIADAAQLTFDVPKWATGLILAVLVALITVGGIQSISRISTKIVPFMALVYITSCLGVMYLHAEQLPEVISQILNAAFTSTAATGGFAGATMMLALQAGVARGVFSNESGLGSAPIAAAAAKTNSCVEQGLVCMTGTFFDTILICTMTGITLVLTGAWQSEVAGTAMTNLAFTQGIGSQLGFYLVNIGLLFFAFTTIIGWNYYGERCTEYLLGVKAIKGYRWVFVLLVAAGATLHLDLIWIIADIVNGLMAIPNLIGLIGLRHVIAAETFAYFSAKDIDTGSAETEATM